MRANAGYSPICNGLVALYTPWVSDCRYLENRGISVAKEKDASHPCSPIPYIAIKGAASAVHSLGTRLIHSEKEKGRSITSCNPVLSNPEPGCAKRGVFLTLPSLIWCPPEPPPK